MLNELLAFPELRSFGSFFIFLPSASGLCLAMRFAKSRAESVFAHANRRTSSSSETNVCANTRSSREASSSEEDALCIIIRFIKKHPPSR